MTGREAWQGWRRLLMRFGDPAPGPVPAGMRVFPEPSRWATALSWEWHRAGVGPTAPGRSCGPRLASRLEAVVDLTADEADRRLRAVPGIGPWTAAEIRQRALGDPDAVSLGDYHLPRLVAYALAGRCGPTTPACSNSWALRRTSAPRLPAAGP